MPIIRNASATGAQFSVTLNVVLKGSKQMAPEQQEAMMPVGQAHVVIADADDPANVLVDEVVPAREFGTGSVGYGLSLRAVEFSR
jgi:hypothetical protein